MLKINDVVIIHDTRNFHLKGENEQDCKINWFPIPLGVVRKVGNRVLVTVCDENYEAVESWWFNFESLEKIDEL